MCRQLVYNFKATPKVNSVYYCGRQLVALALFLTVCTTVLVYFLQILQTDDDYSVWTTFGPRPLSTPNIYSLNQTLPMHC